MSKITVGEIRELASNTEKEKSLEYKGLKVKIKQYLPILKKINLVSSAYQSAIDAEDELNVINYNSLHIAFSIMIIETYTNITLPKNKIEAFDLITQIGLYNLVYDMLPESEKAELEQVLDNYILEKQERYERENTLESIVKSGKDELMKAIGNLVGKLPEQDKWGEIAKEVGKDLSQFDSSKLKFLQDFQSLTQGKANADI